MTGDKYSRRSGIQVGHSPVSGAVLRQGFVGYVVHAAEALGLRMFAQYLAFSTFDERVNAVVIGGVIIDSNTTYIGAS